MRPAFPAHFIHHNPERIPLFPSTACFKRRDCVQGHSNRAVLYKSRICWICQWEGGEHPASAPPSPRPDLTRVAVRGWPWEEQGFSWMQGKAGEHPTRAVCPVDQELQRHGSKKLTGGWRTWMKRLPSGCQEHTHTHRPDSSLWGQG